MKYKKPNIFRFQKGGLTRNEKAQARAVKGAEFYQPMLARNNASQVSSMADRMKAMDPRNNLGAPAVNMPNQAINNDGLDNLERDRAAFQASRRPSDYYDPSQMTRSQAFAQAHKAGLKEFSYGNDRIAVKFAEQPNTPSSRGTSRGQSQQRAETVATAVGQPGQGQPTGNPNDILATMGQVNDFGRGASGLSTTSGYTGDRGSKAFAVAGRYLKQAFAPREVNATVYDTKNNPETYTEEYLRGDDITGRDMMYRERILRDRANKAKELGVNHTPTSRHRPAAPATPAPVPSNTGGSGRVTHPTVHDTSEASAFFSGLFGGNKVASRAFNPPHPPQPSYRKRGGILFQQGGQIPQEQGVSQELIADFVVRFLSSQGMGEEQILDPSGQGFSQEAQQMVMPILEQIGEDPQFWQAYQQDPEGTIGQISQSPEQVAMARKGARLEILRKGGKKKKMKSRKCKCGCEITTVKEEGGKLSSKCACGCK